MGLTVDSGKERRSDEGLGNRGNGDREVVIGKYIITKHLLGVRQ